MCSGGGGGGGEEGLKQVTNIYTALFNLPSSVFVLSLLPTEVSLLLKLFYVNLVLHVSVVKHNIRMYRTFSSVTVMAGCTILISYLIS